MLIEGRCDHYLISLYKRLTVASYNGISCSTEAKNWSYKDTFITIKLNIYMPSPRKVQIYMKSLFPGIIFLHQRKKTETKQQFLCLVRDKAC